MFKHVVGERRNVLVLLYQNRMGLTDLRAITRTHVFCLKTVIRMYTHRLPNLLRSCVTPTALLHR